MQEGTRCKRLAGAARLVGWAAVLIHGVSCSGSKDSPKDRNDDPTEQVPTGTSPSPTTPTLPGSPTGQGTASATGGEPGATPSEFTPPTEPGATSPEATSTDPVLTPSSSSSTAPPEVVDEFCSVALPVELSDRELLLLFDISASMGSFVQPFWDPELKWEPVLAAAQRFFNDPASAGTSITMMFFPSENAMLSGQPAFGGAGQLPTGMAPSDAGVEDVPAEAGASEGPTGDFCSAADYMVPHVPLTPLPSGVFETAIAAVTPGSDEEWRLGGPLAPVLEGSAAVVEQALRADADRAVVFLTDGQPALCSTTLDNIESVVEAAAALSVLAPLHVIAIADPVTDEEPEPLDYTTELNLVAEAGGTQAAHQIPTGDPGETEAAVFAALVAIGQQGPSCRVEIPEPPDGQSASLDGLVVQIRGGGPSEDVLLGNDCATGSAYTLDDPQAPTALVLCPVSCEQAKAAVADGGELTLGYGCDVPGVTP